MISRLIRQFAEAEQAWDYCVEVLAALPGNY
jgi:hypothetical protein